MKGVSTYPLAPGADCPALALLYSPGGRAFMNLAHSRLPHV